MILITSLSTLDQALPRLLSADLLSVNEVEGLALCRQLTRLISRDEPLFGWPGISIVFLTVVEVVLRYEGQHPGV